MVQFIQRSPSFGELLGQGLGQGLSKGIDFATQLGMEKFKTAQRKKLIEAIEGGQGSPSNGSSLEMQSQGQMNPDYFSKAKAYAAAGETDLARAATEEAKLSRKETFAREQALEPKLQELQGELASTEESGLRFDRLKELTSPQFEDKFPPSLMTGLLTKNGELNSIAASQLSPEAQEFTKLVIDEIQGAQKTYGGKVSNFEAAQYLKKLPGLLNTAEGRRRVLRDLRIMNKMTQMHDQGVLDIMEKYGNKIPLSKANAIYRKEHAKEEAQMRKAFIRPEEFPFTDLNDFNASIYEGTTIEDPETGQKFTSDGRTWNKV